MKILIDGMGGDFAPEEIVKGAIKAASEISETVVIIGPEEAINEQLRANRWKGDNIEVVDATEVITNEEQPAMAVRKKKDSTIVKGMNMIKTGEADIFISGGSTGALLAGGPVTLGRIKGIKRPAIAAWFPRAGKEGVTLLLDCGASVEAKPEYIYQYGIMGSIFVKGITGNEAPVVRLLNVGAEEGKGDDLHKTAFDMLKNSGLNFMGNIEARDVIFGETDVVVTDGFSGNILLKTAEGVIKYMMKELKGVFYKSFLNKLAAGVLKNDLQTMKKSLDVNEVGGTALIGICKPVIKAHGSSNADSIFAAVRQAIEFYDSGIISDIEKNIDYMKVKQE